MKCDFCGKKDYKKTLRYRHCSEEKKFMEKLDEKTIAIASNGKVYISGGGRLAVAGRGVLKKEDESYQAILRFERKYKVRLFQSWDFTKQPIIRNQLKEVKK